MANRVYTWLSNVAKLLAMKETGYDQEMIDNDPNKADEIVAVGNRILDDIDDSVTTITNKLVEKYNLKGVSDNLIISILEAVAQEAYVGNVSLKSIENNEYIQSVGESAAKEQKRVEVVQSVMDKCFDVAFGYTVASAVSYSAIETMVPERTAFMAAAKAVKSMNMTSIIDVRRLLDDYRNSDEPFMEVKTKLLRNLDFIANYDKGTTIIKHDTKGIRDLKDVVKEQRNLLGEQKSQIFTNAEPSKDYKLNEEKGNEIAFEALKFLLKDLTFNGLGSKTEKGTKDIAEAKDAFITNFVGKLLHSFPTEKNEPPEYTALINKKMIDAKNLLESAKDEEDLLRIATEITISMGPKDMDEPHKRAYLHSFIHRDSENMVKDIRETTLESKVLACVEDKEVATRLLGLYTKLSKAHNFAQNIDMKDIALLILNNDAEIYDGLRKNIERLTKVNGKRPKNAAKAKEALYKVDILRDVRINKDGPNNEDAMIALMLGSSLNLLEQGVPNDELKEALKGAMGIMIDLGLIDAQKTIQLYDDLKEAQDKNGIQQAIGSYMETLDLEGIQPNDRDIIIKVCSGTFDSNSVIQENIKYTEMCGRVKDKFLLSRAQQFMELLDNPSWNDDGHSNMDRLLITLRTQEPELHEYMLKKMEEANERLRLERVEKRVELYAEKNGLYRDNGDGTRSIDASVQEELFNKYNKLTKGHLTYIIEREKEEVEKLKQEREKTPEIEEAPELPTVEEIKTPEENSNETKKKDSEDREL